MHPLEIDSDYWLTKKATEKRRQGLVVLKNFYSILNTMQIIWIFKCENKIRNFLTNPINKVKLAIYCYS